MQTKPIPLMTSTGKIRVLPHGFEAAQQVGHVWDFPTSALDLDLPPCSFSSGKVVLSEGGVWKVKIYLSCYQTNLNPGCLSGILFCFSFLTGDSARGVK